MICSINKKIPIFTGEYDNHAHLQRVACNRMVKRFIANRDFETVLDFGCGTAFVASSLANHSVSFEKYIGIDISREILVMASNRMKNLGFEVLEDGVDISKNTKKEAKLIINFAEHKDSMELVKSANLVISNFAIQWFKNSINWIEKCTYLMNKGSYMYHSIPIRGSFKDILRISNKCNNREISLGRNLITEEELKRTGWKIVDIFSLTEFYESIEKLLHSIKKLGASTVEQNSYSVKEMRCLMQACKLEFNNKVPLSYRIAIVEIEL